MIGSTKETATAIGSWSSNSSGLSQKSPSPSPHARTMNKPESKKAVAFLRVSSLSQVDGHSLDAQDRLFRQLCDGRGWEAVRVYREEGTSAHSESVKQRPVFRQLMEDAKKGEFDVVVVHTLDRGPETSGSLWSLWPTWPCTTWPWSPSPRTSTTRRPRACR